MKLADTWCPDRSPVERVARLILNESTPKFRYDLTDQNMVREWLANGAHYPGNVLPDVIEDRSRLLAEEIERVRIVVGHLSKIVGLASLELMLT